MSSPAHLTEGRLGVAMLRFGLPYAVAMGFHGLFNCVDLVIVGRVGPGAVAAVTIAGVIGMVAMLSYNGVANLTASYVARRVGANDHRGAGAIATDMFWVTLAASIAIGAVLWLLSDPLVTAFGADAVTTAAARDYLRVFAAGSGTMFFILFGAALLRGAGRTFWPVAVLIGANLLNLALDVLLVFGCLGAPRMGVPGAAWATVISRGLGAAVLMVIVLRRGAGFRLFGDGSRWRTRRAVDVLWRGVVSSMQLTIRVAATYLVLALASSTASALAGGEAARAALDGIGICIRFEMVAVFIGLGWGSAAGAMVGQNLGAERSDRSTRAAWYAVGASAVIAVVCGIILLSTQEWLFALVAPDAGPAAFAAGREYLLWTVPVWAVAHVGIVLSQALNGAGSTRTPFVLDACVYGALQCLVAWALIHSRLGVAGCWAAVGIAHVAASLAYTLVFAAGRWRRTAAWMHHGEMVPEAPLNDD